MRQCNYVRVRVLRSSLECIIKQFCVRWYVPGGPVADSSVLFPTTRGQLSIGSTEAVSSFVITERRFYRINMILLVSGVALRLELSMLQIDA